MRKAYLALPHRGYCYFISVVIVRQKPGKPFLKNIKVRTEQALTR